MSGRYDGTLGRLFELHDIAVRFDEQLTGTPERRQQLARDLDRVRDAYGQERERHIQAGMTGREINHRVREHWNSRSDQRSAR